MQGLIASYRLASFGRLQWLLIGSTLCLAVLAVALGAFACLLQLALLALSYLAVTFLCYHPEAQHLRDRVDQFYASLFHYLFRTGHAPRGCPPAGQPAINIAGGLPSRPGGGVKAAKLCHKEAQKIIQLLMRDFVVSWYSDITGDVEFPEDIQKILEHISLEINLRIQKIDLDEFIPEILALVLPYLEAVNEAGAVDYNGVNVFDTSHEICLRTFEGNPRVSHRALRGTGAETRYYRQAVDVLLQCAVPVEYGNCDMAFTFVREILVRNVVEPVIDLLCDPSFLNEAIPIVLAKASPEKVRRQLLDIHEENEELEKQISRGRLLLKHKRAMSQRRRFCSLSGRFNQSAFVGLPQSLSVHPAATPFGSYTEIDTPSGPASDTGSDRPIATAMPVIADLGTARSPNVALSSRASQLLSESPPSASPPHWSPSLRMKRRSTGVMRAPNFPDIDITTSLPPTLSSSSPQEIHHHGASSTSQRFATGDDTLIEEGCEPESEIERTYRQSHDPDLVIIDLPPIFVQNHVRVEKGASSHVGYIFKFPQRMLTMEDLLELGVREGEGELKAMRRYSDFVTFHATLLKSPLSIYIKAPPGLELPEKRSFSSLISKLPFVTQDLDPTIILERRQGLERYIQSVSSIPEVVRSDLFRQFLKSGVKVLREAHVVNPPQPPPPPGRGRGGGAGGGARRKTLLGIMKGHGNFLSNEDAEMAKPVPKCPMESVLSSYLNTHLPLPCRTLHTPHSVSAPQLQPESHSQPINGSHSESIDGSHSQPTDGSHSQPTDGSHTQPTDGSHSESIDGSHSQPTDGSQFQPSNKSQPTDGSHSQPIDVSHSQPTDGSHSQPANDRGSLSHQVPAAEPLWETSSVSADSSSCGSFTELHMQAQVCEGDAPLVTRSLPPFKTAHGRTMEKSASSASLQLERNIKKEGAWGSRSVAAGIAELALDASQDYPDGGPQRNAERTTLTAPTLDSCITSSATHSDGQPGTIGENARATSFKDSNVRTELERGSSNADIKERSPVLSTYHKCRQLLIRLAVILKQLVTFVVFMVREGFPLTRPQTSSELLRRLQKTAPMTNALLSLAKEASKRNCPQLWATNEATQIAVLTLVGGGTERFLRKELNELLYDEETWCRGLYHLRHTLWPGGVFDRSPRRQKSEEEKAELKRQAAEAFKKFLPNFFPHIVGSEDYDRAVKHCIECLQNPRINRHFLLGVIDLLLKRLVPEIDHKSFQKQLAKMRTANVNIR